MEEPEIETEDPLEQSAGRSAQSGVNRYAVSRDIVKYPSQRSIDTFRPLAESWHRFLGLASRKEEETKRKRALEPAEVSRPPPAMHPPLVPATAKQARAVGRMARERATRQALRMSGAGEIRYRSRQQEEALERIMDWTDSALAVVLPTGGGKTLLFTAPACLENPGVRSWWSRTDS